MVNVKIYFNSFQFIYILQFIFILQFIYILHTLMLHFIIKMKH